MSIALGMDAQVKVKNRNNDPKPMEPRNGPANNAQSNSNSQAEHWGNGSFQGNITIGFGNGPYYGNPYPYNNYYSNGYNWKKATRNSIRAAKYTINDAVAFDTWNDIYSPLVAKAIRHYNYSRQLYWWGNYKEAYNHAERARYLAWYSLQYFQNPGYYNGGGYQPNPYGDPYDPYYKKDQSGNEGQRKKEDNSSRTQEKIKQDEIDNNLPDGDKNDRELLKSYDRSVDKDE
jgi:hypothetical protein